MYPLLFKTSKRRDNVAPWAETCSTPTCNFLPSDPDSKVLQFSISDFNFMECKPSEVQPRIFASFISNWMIQQKRNMLPFFRRCVHTEKFSQFRGICSAMELLGSFPPMK